MRMCFSNGVSTTSWAIAQMYLMKGLEMWFKKATNSTNNIFVLNVDQEILGKIRNAKGYCPQCGRLPEKVGYCEFCNNPNN